MSDLYCEIHHVHKEKSSDPRAPLLYLCPVCENEKRGKYENLEKIMGKKTDIKEIIINVGSRGVNWTCPQCSFKHEQLPKEPELGSELVCLNCTSEYELTRQLYKQSKYKTEAILRNALIEVQSTHNWKCPSCMYVNKMDWEPKLGDMLQCNSCVKQFLLNGVDSKNNTCSKYHFTRMHRSEETETTEVK